jgi:hypothetical protein
VGSSDPTFRKPLPEADLRDVKADAVERLTDQARALGAEPNLVNIERFVAPIVEKIDRDHNALLCRGSDPNATPPVLARQDREGVETTQSESLGQYDFAKGEFVPTAKGQQVLARRNRPDTLNERAVRAVVKRIVSEPEHERPWKALVQSAMFRPLPPGHTGLACAGCGGARVCLVREGALRAIVGKFIERFGDPRPQLLREDAEHARRPRG